MGIYRNGPLPTLVVENHERRHTYLPPKGVDYAVALIFGRYLPTFVIEDVLGKGRVLAQRALVATHR